VYSRTTHHMLHDTATVDDRPLAHVPMNFLCGDIDAQFRTFLKSKQEEHAALSSESTMSAQPAAPSKLVGVRAPPAATTSMGQVAERGVPASSCHGFFSKRRSGPTQPTECTESQPAAAMPAGWECKRTPEGLAYFVDHNTRTTHWEPPLQRGGGPDSISIYQPTTELTVKQEHEEMLALYREAKAAGYLVDPAGDSAIVSATAPTTSLVLPSGAVRERLNEVERIIERLQSLKKPVFGMDSRGGVISPFNSTATEAKDRWPTSPRSGFDLLAELLTTPVFEPATPLSPARELVDSTKPPWIQVQKGRLFLREERVNVRRRLFRDAAVHTDMTVVGEEEQEEREEECREEGCREHAEKMLAFEQCDFSPVRLSTRIVTNERGGRRAPRRALASRC
jgi:hypothetical protein